MLGKRTHDSSELDSDKGDKISDDYSDSSSGGYIRKLPIKHNHKSL